MRAYIGVSRELETSVYMGMYGKFLKDIYPFLLHLNKNCRHIQNPDSGEDVCACGIKTHDAGEFIGIQDDLWYDYELKISGNYDVHVNTDGTVSLTYWYMMYILSEMKIEIKNRKIL